jgi:transposase
VALQCQVTVPVGLHLTFLPPYAPELQPAERLVRLPNEPVVDRHFATLDELQDVQVERCRTLRLLPALIRAQTHFHWWPNDIP